MAKKKENTEQSEKKSRAKYNCPDELEKLIDLVNLLPPEPDIEEMSKRIADLAAEVYGRNPDGKPREISTLQARFKALITNTELFNYLVDEFFGLINMESAPKNFSYLVQSKKILQYIAQTNQQKNEDEDFAFYRTVSGINFVVSFYREKNNAVRPSMPSLAEILQDPEIPQTRIRLCEICSRIFWASYKNSFTCSKPCLNALRQRRHRKTNKEAINEKRRANYRQNKKLKEIKEKKNNGTL